MSNKLSLQISKKHENKIFYELIRPWRGPFCYIQKKLLHSHPCSNSMLTKRINVQYAIAVLFTFYASSCLDVIAKSLHTLVGHLTIKCSRL